jgi:nucleotide-binding universal stress UspA family protein
VAVGTDFTAGSVRAARRALRLPLSDGATIELTHAAPRVAPRSFEAGVKAAALAALDRQAADLSPRAEGPRTRVRKSLAAGPPAEALAREARTRRCDLIVIGPRGGPGMPDLDLGSTAERLLAESTVPVLIARRPPGRPYRHALVAVDLGGSSDAALALATRLLADGARRVTLIHAVALPMESGIRLVGTSAMEVRRLRDLSREEAEDALADTARRLRHRGFAVAWAVEDGDPRSVVLTAARRRRADLVALGTRRAGDRTGLLIGSVARWVARRARCDVLVARAPRS